MTRKVVSSVGLVTGLALFSFLVFSFISLVKFTEMVLNLFMTLTTL
ncbi:hypothetical protein [Ectobacillus funiculus]|uniref:Uncharacterized protein n=1 Tax=Ectobacillus funiculus TaxID=137993 RepID=A0ABV5WFB2_9BACI